MYLASHFLYENFKIKFMKKKRNGSRNSLMQEMKQIIQFLTTLTAYLPIQIFCKIFWKDILETNTDSDGKFALYSYHPVLVLKKIFSFLNGRKHLCWYIEILLLIFDILLTCSVVSDSSLWLAVDIFECVQLQF